MKASTARVAEVNVPAVERYKEMRDLDQVSHLGEDTSGTWQELRKQPRDQFVPGKFVSPHGACFDHAGNIFVVEWVEVGRVTKLKRVA